VRRVPCTLPSRGLIWRWTKHAPSPRARGVIKRKPSKDSIRQLREGPCPHGGRKSLFLETPCNMAGRHERLGDQQSVRPLPDEIRSRPIYGCVTGFMPRTTYCRAAGPAPSAGVPRNTRRSIPTCGRKRPWAKPAIGSPPSPVRAVLRCCGCTPDRNGHQQDLEAVRR
jgi:hypothetical protein